MVAAASVGFVIFFIYSPLDANSCERGSALLAPMLSAFQRDNILGVSLPSLIAGSMCVLSFGPPSLYGCSKGEGYIDIYYLASLLHATSMLVPTLCFAYTVSVLDKIAFANLHHVLSVGLGCADTPINVSNFDLVVQLSRLALYALVVATVVGHSSLVLHPWNDDEKSIIERKTKSVGAPLSMVCSALASFTFAYLSYDLYHALPFADECGKTSGATSTMLFYQVLACTVSCAMAFGLMGASNALKSQIRAGELSNISYHQERLKNYIMTHVVFAEIIIICGVSILHGVFVHDWDAVVSLDGQLDAQSHAKCVPEFNMLTEILVASAVSLYLLAVLVPHFGWLTQKSRPIEYQTLTSTNTEQEIEDQLDQ